MANDEDCTALRAANMALRERAEAAERIGRDMLRELLKVDLSQDTYADPVQWARLVAERHNAEKKQAAALRAVLEGFASDENWTKAHGEWIWDNTVSYPSNPKEFARAALDPAQPGAVAKRSE